LEVKQSIPHTTVTFYGNCVKIREDFPSNFGDKRTGCCITTTHRLTLPFSPGNSSPKRTRLSSSAAILTKVVIEAELQAVLNTLTGHDFQDAFKMAEALVTVHTRGRGLLGG
jgi:hypothetical protein